MARSARDLRLGLNIMAGPDAEEAVGYRLELLPPRHERLDGFRVLVQPTHPLVPTDPELSAAVEAFGRDLATAGATVQSASGVLPDLAETTRVYIALLGAVMGLGQTPEAAALGRARVAELPPDDPSIAAMRVRANVISHADWLLANEARIKLRWRWRDIFRDWDAVICPPTPMLAPTHAEAAAPTLIIDGTEVDRGDPVAWASVATAPGLPATVLPYGMSRDGRPIGIQVIGPYLEDFTPIRLAELFRPDADAHRDHHRGTDKARRVADLGCRYRAALLGRQSRAPDFFGHCRRAGVEDLGHPGQCRLHLPPPGGWRHRRVQDRHPHHRLCRRALRTGGQSGA
jgi:amidase